MAKVNFTAARIEGHKCEFGKDQTFLWDARAPGLGLRATASGAKSYIFQGKVHGGSVRVTIGDPRSWSIADAQEEARRLQVLVDAGINPREHKAEQRAVHDARKAEQRRREVTFGEAWDAYLVARSSKWSERHLRDHEQHSDEGGKARKRGAGTTVAGPLATLRPIKLTELTGERIARWLNSETAARPTMTALSYRLLRAFIRWAAETNEFGGTVPADAYKARSVRDAVPRARAKENDCLQREQLPAWFAGVRRIQNPVIAAYLQALLITGARREEMAALKWVDVDFQWRSLRIADKVEEAGRIIPLTPYLASLLSVLPRRNKWVFSSPAAADGKIAEPRLAHNQVLAASGLPHLTLHGLRRSFGTLSEWSEVPTGVVAQIMGHKPSAIAEKHYRRRPLDLLRMYHDKLEAQLLEQAGIQAAVGESPNLSLRVVA
ncbi:tyrosine-type recombinase/integrase [Caballeronia sordidicola]|uniref:Phage integrase n=1 Tax=Caballeronia sordidicola TaxID=196367 RepID=A0A242MX45_CABSO|nr:integrase family protein [Caballeronia sordidicola]OTP75955.1 Phage integrase [Caballeronia sordidicola]